MVSCLFRELGNDRHVQTATDDLSDLPARHSLFSDRVVPGARSLLQREPIEVSGIEAVHCGPAVEPIADIRRNTFFAGYSDHVRDEALLDWVMNLRKTYHRHTHATRRD
jgi:hypothetical protein